MGKSLLAMNWKREEMVFMVWENICIVSQPQEATLSEDVCLLPAKLVNISGKESLADKILHAPDILIRQY